MMIVATATIITVTNDYLPATEDGDILGLKTWASVLLVFSTMFALPRGPWCLPLLGAPQHTLLPSPQG